MRNLIKTTAIASILFAAGCMVPAGQLENEASFAEAAAANHFAQTAHLNPANAIITLNDRFRRVVPTMINFDFNQATLDAEAMDILNRQAEWIKRYPMVRFKVFGHTDRVGSNGYNQALGMRRARAAVNYLISQGVPRHSLIAAVSRGEREPLINTQDRERLNRRTVTVVAGYVPGYKGYDFDGKVAAAIYDGYVNVGNGPREVDTGGSGLGE